jgi:peroxiredoxin (alkyl hydroperoxide reductase subunit C)
MRKLTLLFFLVIPATFLLAQEIQHVTVPLVGEKAPLFTAQTTNGILNFPADFGRKWKILVSHPQDFTPVCSTELLELAYAQSEFDKLNTSIAVISTDPIDIHFQWKKAMEEVNYQGRGQVKLKFPLIDDDKIIISKQYGMIHPSSNSTRDVRGVFILDPDNIIQAIFFYPNNVGRNIEELKRTLTALQTSRADNVLTPANWQKGQDVLIHVRPVSQKDSESTRDVSWFMTFKKSK